MSPDAGRRWRRPVGAGLPLILLLALLIGLATVMIFDAPDAQAATCTSSGDATTSAGYDSFDGMATGAQECDGGGEEVAVDHPDVPGTWHHQPICLGGATTCDAEGQQFCGDGSPMEYVWFVPEGGLPGAVTVSCPDAPSMAEPGPTIADVISALHQVKLPASTLIIQPPGGQTLVNFKTNFLTEAQSFDRSVTLIGHQVDFRIRPARFVWHYGDGTSQSTTKPGDRYPNLVITHEYLTKGSVAPSVDTVWEADYRIDAGAWAPVPDAVTMTGAAQQLTIKSATPVLVGS